MIDVISAYNDTQTGDEKDICDRLYDLISSNLPEAESKIWHAHPVWFLAGNPVVGYSKLKAGIRLFFWSGASFDEDGLKPGSGKFKDASIIFNGVEQIDENDIRRWIEKARNIQWDYRNLIKRKGVLLRLK